MPLKSVLARWFVDWRFDALSGAMPAARGELPPPAGTTRPSSRSPRVLVVVDLEANRLLVELFL